MRARLKHWVRRAIVHGLYYSGVLWMLASWKLRGRAVVLTYHRVLPEGSDSYSADGIVVRPATFERQMRFLHRHFRLLSLETLADALNTRSRIPSRSCVVTFDDGWIDNYEHALPVLRAHEVPATVFVAVDYIGTDLCFWQERLTRALVEQADENPACELIAAHAKTDPAMLTPSELRRAARAAVQALKDEAAGDADALAERIATADPDPTVAAGSNNYDRFMSWSQVAGITENSAVSVGSHGCSHVPFPELEDADLRLELSRARTAIESVLDCKVTTIAYPNGDYDDKVVELARQAGYSAGLTTDRGYIDSGSDPMRLGRINIHEASTATMPDFLCTLAGVFSGYRSFKAARTHARSRY